MRSTVGLELVSSVWRHLWQRRSFGGGGSGGGGDCSALMLAIAEGRTPDLQALLMKGSGGDVRLKCQDPATGRTPLHAAAFYGRQEATRLLLDWLLSRNAAATALNARDREGSTPVYLAALEGNVKTLKLLLNHRERTNKVQTKFEQSTIKAQPDLSNWLGRTPLHAACERNWPDVVQALILSKASINAVDYRQSTPLHVAAQWGFLEPLKVLLKQEQKDVNMRNRLGWAPIHGAARRGHESVVAELARCEVGANLDLQDSKGWAPLHHAADSGHEKAVEALLNAKVTIDLRESTQGVTALHFASHRGHLGVVRLLLKCGASQKVVSNDGWTPLHVACRLQRSEVVLLLLEQADAPVSARGRRGWTPLHVAAWTGNAAIVRCLLKREAVLNAPLTDSWTPLNLAAMSGRFEALEALLVEMQQRGIDPIQKETLLGLTPLDIAVQFQHTKCALRLIYSSIGPGGRGRHHDCFKDVASAESPLMKRVESRTMAEASRNWKSGRTIDGHQLHAAMVAAGFVRSRAALQAAAASHLQTLIWDYSGDQVRLCGSFAEGWGNSVSRLSGRVDEDSDIDVSEFFKYARYHLEGQCRCDDRSVPTDGLSDVEDAVDGGLKETAKLKYCKGHVEFNGFAAHPARTQYGCLGRPAMDMALMYRCCTYPPIQILQKSGHHLPQELLSRLNAEVSRSNSCPLIGAALPGMEGRQLRVSTKWLELPFVHSFTDVQGQLYTILKYLVKRVINKRGGRLKSFHAKTLAFRMVSETPPDQWLPERLPELTASALDKLAEGLQNPDPEVGMYSFFFADAPLYLKRSSSNPSDNRPTLTAVLETRENLSEVLARFAHQLLPLRKNTGLDYHPFMLLPRSKQVKQLDLQLATDRETCQGSTEKLGYHQLHEFVRRCLRKLAVGGGNGGHRRDLKALLEDIARVPDCARTARECLAALAHLRYDQPTEALKLLGDLLESGHRPMRGLAAQTDNFADADDVDSVRRRLLSADSAWRFCFVQESPQQQSFRFDFLPAGSIRFPRRLLRYDDYHAANFDALAKSLYLQLHRDRGSTGDCNLSRAWFSDMLDAEMDSSEVELLVAECNDEDLLLRLVREHKETLAQSRTVHCMLAQRINKSKFLQTTLKRAFLEGLDD